MQEQSFGLLLLFGFAGMKFVERKWYEMFVYLDNSATTRQYDEVTEHMLTLMRDRFGNPSSLHRLGLEAEKELKKARRSVAELMGAPEHCIVFTSGGTESDNTALFSAVQARKHQGNHVITSKVEHHAVLETCRRLERMGVLVDYIDVDENGLIRMDQLEQAVNEQTILISLMHVNNEMGTIQPLEQLAEIKQKFPNLLVHTDAVQSYGKIPISLSGEHSFIDLLSVSAHKIHGPKGIGALYIREGLSLPPFVYGGGQEKGQRSGTENVPAIAGFGVAAKLAKERWKERISAMELARLFIMVAIREEIPNTKINGFEDKGCVPSILNASFLGCRGEVLLHSLEQKGIYVSTGSACSSNSKKKGSHVLKAAGLTDEEVEGAVRFSFSEDNTVDQMDYVYKELKKAVKSFRRLQKAFHGRKNK